MKIKPIFHQFNCRETQRADYRQARAVLRYKPDIIIFELPEKNGKSESPYNRLPCDKKPKKEIKLQIKNLVNEYKKSKDGVALSDAKTWENISRLWSTGVNTELFFVDAPKEFRQELHEIWSGCYPCAMNNWLWWVQIYLRERIMANHIQNILSTYKKKDAPVILVFLQSFHWTHVKYLLSNPSKEDIYRYYFGKFWKINKKNIKGKIKDINKMFYKYWIKYSDIK